MPFFKNMGPEPPVAKAMEGQALTLEKFKEILKAKKTKIHNKTKLKKIK